MTAISPQRIPFRRNRCIAAGVDFLYSAGFRLRHLLSNGPEKDLKTLLENNIKEILVFRPDGLGDLILSTPLFPALKKVFPGCRITLAVASWSYELARLIKDVDEIIKVDVPWFVGSSFARWKNLLKSVKHLRDLQYDLAIDLRGDFRNNILISLTGARFTAGFSITGCADALTHVTPVDDDHHSTSLIGAMLRSLAPDIDFKLNSFLAIPDVFKEAASKLLAEISGGSSGKKTVAIHPGARWPGRQWLPERYAEIADRLKGQGFNVVFTGASQEKAFVERIESLMQFRPINLVGKTDFHTFLGILAIADAFLGVDSGPMHISSALGRPTIAIYGAATPEIVGPRGLYDVIISHCEEFDCSPCAQTICLRPVDSCMHAVSVEEIWAALQRALKTGQKGWNQDK